MSATTLAPISAFALGLHPRQWCVQGLPHEIGARRFVREADPDLLGVAVQGRRRAIGLSSAIVGTPLELPVLAHECGHLLLGHDIGYCSLTVRTHVREERAAWEGAALLAIPTEDAVAFAGHRVTVHELAERYEVAPALVYMRGALAVLLGEADGSRERARHHLGAARRSLESWMAWQARTI